MRVGCSKGGKKSLQAATFVALLMLVTLTAAGAGKPFAAPQAAQLAPTASAGSLAQVTLSLLLVLAAVLAAGWVVRRLKGLRGTHAAAITVIADLPLGTKEHAVLVQVADQQLLLGVAPGAVNLLHVLATPIEAREIAGLGSGASGLGQSEASLSARAPVSFKAILKRSLGL